MLAFGLAIVGALIVLYYPYYRQHAIKERFEAIGASVTLDRRPPWPFVHCRIGDFFNAITWIRFCDHPPLHSSRTHRKHVEAADLELLRHCTDLLGLEMDGTDVTDDSLRIIQDSPTLETLDLSDTMVGDGSLTFVSGLHSLNFLALRKTTISDEGLAQLEKLPKLTVLDLSETAVGDKGAAHLSQICGVSWLVLARTRVTDDGLRYIGRMKQLRNLCLNGTAITDKGIEHLGGLTNLYKLFLSDTRITDAGLRNLRELRSLEDLSLHNTRITDAGLTYLAGLSLHENSLDLDIGETRVTDNAVVPLCQLHKLWSLNIVDTRITKEGVVRLRKSLPGLTQLFSD